jgi:hypothetical protein
MVITGKRYEELQTFATVLTNQYNCNEGDYKDEILHDFIIVNHKKLDLQTDNDNIVFIYLRNFIINDLKKKKIQYVELQPFHLPAYEEIDFEEEKIKIHTDNIKQKAIDSVKQTLSDPREIDVFNECFEKQISQRELARQREISHYIIHRVAKKITNKIKKKYNELQELQKQNNRTKNS